MLDSIKNKAQRATLLDLLTFIVYATLSEPFHAFVPKDEAQRLKKAEPTFVEIDASVTNPDAEGQIKVVATQAAIDAVKAAKASATATSTASAGTSAPAETKSAVEETQFEILTLTEIPTINRGGSKESNYPFEKLAAHPAPGNAFFVPSTETRPNPAKSLASTVASANKRYSKKDGRAFTVRKGEHGGKAGAWIVRTK